jgi:uncharacterized membrane protein YphA (DoxX/SURF4 family)
MAGKGGWIYNNRVALKSMIRVVFGVVWLIDGSFKFQPGITDTFTQLIQQAGAGQPAWLLPWFNFWFNVVSQNPAFWVYVVGLGEVLIGIALILGGLRKITYVVGMVLSLFIWAVPEGLGGPYGPGSTDIGTGIIYAFVFLSLMIFNAMEGPSKYSADTYIEKRVKWWHKLAEFSP